MVRDHHAYAHHSERHGRLVEWLILGMGLAMCAALVFVWSAGEIAGGIWYRRWPPVSLAQSVDELVRLCLHPSDPMASGIPAGAGYFVILALLVGAAAAVLVSMWRLLYRPRVYWAPPRLLGRGGHRAFLRAYRVDRGSRWR